MTRPFESLSEQEVLALAVYIERANARRFRAFADIFRGYDAPVAARFDELAAEEGEHEDLLTQRFRKRFGKEVTKVDEADVNEVIESADLDDPEHLIFDSLTQARVYELALQAEQNALAFYQRAAASSEDSQLASLYRELAEIEEGHSAWVEDKLRALSHRR